MGVTPRPPPLLQHLLPGPLLQCVELPHRLLVMAHGGLHLQQGGSTLIQLYGPLLQLMSVASKASLRQRSVTRTHTGITLSQRQYSLEMLDPRDWMGYPNTRKSTSGYVVFLVDNLISWSSKHQNTKSRFSDDAEYRELHSPPSQAALVYCDNVSVVYLSTNPMQHKCTRHDDIDLHVVHKKVIVGVTQVLHVPTSSQYANILTKGLPTALFANFCSNLNIRPTDDQSMGAC
uniref:Uncharacterized protein n=1 Tax=Oryza brachyantha TaxID=4533 RepID=J3L070_ORYBR